jgi:hypothetical protein
MKTKQTTATSNPHSINRTAKPKRDSSTKTKSRTRVILVPLLVFAAVVAIAAGLLYFFFLHNYAEDAARPIENALTRNGAVKVCSSGDAGRGPDNTQPHYGAQFQLNVNKNEATQLVTKIAKDNGFNLGQRDSAYEYIDQYSDNTSKKSTYPGFDRRNIELGVTINSDSSAKPLSCSMDGKNWITLKADATHTVVSIVVSLPRSN